MSEKTDFLIIKMIIEASPEFQEQTIDYEANEADLIVYADKLSEFDCIRFCFAFGAVGFNSKAYNIKGHDRTNYCIKVYK